MASNFPVGPTDLGRHGASRVGKRLEDFGRTSPSDIPPADIERSISAYHGKSPGPREARAHSPLLPSNAARSDGAPAKARGPGGGVGGSL